MYRYCTIVSLLFTIIFTCTVHYLTCTYMYTHVHNCYNHCRSFGVLLWEIMTLGRTPYPGVENRELLEQIEEHGLKLNKPKSCPIVL